MVSLPLTNTDAIGEPLKSEYSQFPKVAKSHVSPLEPVAAANSSFIKVSLVNVTAVVDDQVI